MQLNLKVRVRNRLFWLALIPAVLILVQTVCALFGVPVTVENVESRLLDLVNAIFAVLAILGIMVDHSTEGLQDSDRAMTYEKPWSDAEYQSIEKHI